eukprot:TRINITY_DN4263_c0_g1_i1.p1 TRINITY_DN4263_c0_g1~~TRINITY_DN4263_c0_g1_i1.p1  ORF type:complete len:626 (-),score=176.08 TRINITY_DN4263_c0_g1_i1:601-2478(-)
MPGPATLGQSQLDNLMEIERLNGLVEQLQAEREAIKERVTIQIRDLVFENEELKRQVAAHKNHLRKLSTLTRSVSLNRVPSAMLEERRGSDSDALRSSSLGLRRIGSDLPPAGPKKPGLTESPAITKKTTDPTSPTGKKGTRSILSNLVKRKTTVLGSSNGLSASYHEDGGMTEFTDDGEIDDAASDDSMESLPKPPLQEFMEEDSPDIIFMKQDGASKPTVKGGTCDRLVERLFHEKYPDPEYTTDFLLTYRSFTTPAVVINLLSQNFNPQPEEGQDWDEFQKTKVVPTQLRITNVLKAWMGWKHSYDFDNDTAMLNQVEAIVRVMEESDVPKQVDIVKKCLEKLKENGKEGVLQPTNPSPTPLFTLPPSGNSSTWTIFDFEPLEMARQITMKQFELFRLISPKEFLNQSWMKSRKEETSPNLLNMIHWTNDYSNWVITQVMSKDSIRGRVDVIKQFLKIAKCCKELHNFDATFAVIAALQSAAIHRLAKTWEKLDRQYKQTFKELQAATSREKNFSKCREILRQSLPPLIPYLGMFLTDLTFIDTGHPDRIKTESGEELINFLKLRQTAGVLKQIQQSQRTLYNFQVVPQIQDFIQVQIKDTITESEAFNRSLQYEPREPAPS